MRRLVPMLTDGFFVGIGYAVGEVAGGRVSMTFTVPDAWVPPEFFKKFPTPRIGAIIVHKG